MAYLGSWKINDYLTFPCNTHDASTGAATDADSVPPYRIYEDETGTAILTGSMAKLDDANTTGFYSEQIQLTAGNGFEAGKSYTIYMSPTVSSVMGTASHTFQVLASVSVEDISANVVDASALAADAALEIADATLKRGVSNVEDTADTTSLAAIILATLESSISGVTWTIRKTGGATFVTKTITVDPAADPIVGVT